jgi:nucleoid DNA-binding protein
MGPMKKRDRSKEDTVKGVNRKLRDRVRLLTGLPREEAMIVVGSVIESLRALIVEGNEVTILGFGTFQIVYRQPRSHRPHRPYRIRFLSSEDFRQDINAAFAAKPPKRARTIISMKAKPRSNFPAYKRSDRNPSPKTP